MKVYIVGYRGNMGARYRAILNMLGHEWAGIDIGSQATGFGPEDANAIIIASPTDKHVHHIQEYAKFGKPILCEKPLTKDAAALPTLANTTGCKIQMVDQYAHMPLTKGKSGPTVYDYFKSGSDGLLWDCINIIKRAKEQVTLRNTSPVWRCVINGDQLSIADMDVAYVKMISAWLADPQDTLPSDIRAHHRVIEYAKEGHA